MARKNIVTGRFSGSTNSRLASGNRLNIVAAIGVAVILVNVGIGIGIQISKPSSASPAPQAPAQAPVMAEAERSTSPAGIDLTALNERILAIEALQQRNAGEIANLTSLPAFTEIRTSIQVLTARVTALETAVISSESSLPEAPKTAPQ